LIPEPKPVEVPYDYDLLTEKEKELQDVIHMVHDVAVRLGFGKLEACQYRFAYDMDPWCSPDVFEKCMEALTPEEQKRMELHCELTDKCLRLTQCLAEEEKQAIKEYNYMTLALRYGWEGRYVDRKAPEYTRGELEEAKQVYGQIMAKYGEKNYDCDQSTSETNQKA
jgi:hypothetical protein